MSAQCRAAARRTPVREASSAAAARSRTRSDPGSSEECGDARQLCLDARSAVAQASIACRPCSVALS